MSGDLLSNHDNCSLLVSDKPSSTSIYSSAAASKPHCVSDVNDSLVSDKHASMPSIETASLVSYSAKRKEVSWLNDNNPLQWKRQRMGFASKSTTSSSMNPSKSMDAYVNEMEPLMSKEPLKSEETLKSEEPLKLEEPLKSEEETLKSEEETFNLDSDSLEALEKLLGDDEGTELDECPDDECDSGEVTTFETLIIPL